MSSIGNPVMVGMADIEILKQTGRLTCIGLGSCIGLCGYDPVSKVAGMAHIMLPEAFVGKGEEKVGKFANTGVPALIETMARAGADKSRILFAMAGGAQVFKFSASSESKLDIGSRNAEAVTKTIRNLGMKVIAQDTGGNSGRTVYFTVETGEFIVRTVTSGEKTLCNLRA